MRGVFAKVSNTPAPDPAMRDGCDTSKKQISQARALAMSGVLVFTRLLKPKRGFHWETDGEQLLRKHKPSYFDGTLLPRTLVLPEPLSSALRRARAESH